MCPTIAAMFCLKFCVQLCQAAPSMPDYYALRLAPPTIVAGEGKVDRKKSQPTNASESFERGYLQ
jgi:hypothetical protein